MEAPVLKPTQEPSDIALKTRLIFMKKYQANRALTLPSMQNRLILNAEKETLPASHNATRSRKGLSRYQYREA